MAKPRRGNPGQRRPGGSYRKRRLKAEVILYHDELEALRRERERLRMAERGGQVGVFDWDLKTGQLFSTGELERLFGLPEGGLAGRYENWARLVHAEDLPRVERVLAAWLESGRPAQRWEYRLLRPDGEVRWLETRAEVIRDRTTGQALRILGTNVDITERRQMEQVLSESEERFRKLLELAPDAVMVHQEGRFVYANAAALRLFGAQGLDELLGQEAIQFVLPEEREAIRRRESEVLRSGGPLPRRQTRLVRLDGRQVVGETAVASVTWMGAPAVQVIVRDITERKKAQQAQAMLAAVVEHSADAIITETLEGIITSWNAGAERLFGYAPGEIIGREASRLVPPERADDLCDHLQRVKRGEVVQRQEVERVHKDGRRIMVSFSLSPIRDRSGRVTGIARVAHDVTELARAQEALRRSQDIYRAMARSIAGGAMSVVDHRLRYTVVEGALLQQLGLRPEHMLGHTVEEVFPGQIGRARAAYFRRALAGEVTSYETEYHQRCVWSQFVPLRDQTGQVMAAMSLAMDVTERKQAEQALKSKSQRLRLLSDAAGELLSGQAPEGAVRELFGKLSRHLGLEVYFNYHLDDSGQRLRLDSWAGVSDQVAHSLAWLNLGQGTCGSVAEQRRAIVIADVQGLQEPQAVCLQPLGLQAYACFPLLVGQRLVGTLAFGSRSRPQFSSEDVDLLQTISYYVAVAQEQAWHRRHLERTVAERTAELREMVAELEHMSYSMVHNMRAPLRGIEGFASLIRHGEGESLRPQSQEMLNRMEHAVHQMDRLVTEALNYNKAVRSRLPIGVVNLERLLRELLETYSEFRPPQAQVVLGGEFPSVLANAVGLSQCLGELIRNGVKFVEPGKLPRLKVWAERLPHPAGWVRIWVEDNGVGISAEAKRTVFNLFERMHGPEYPGTGIGLALVRKLTERMGGHVGLESELGRGSRFWLEFREDTRVAA